MKTIDEEIKDRKYQYDMTGIEGNRCSMDFRAGVKFAQRWIPVEEELPENVIELIGNNIKSENVLVKRQWDGSGEIAIEVNCRFRPSERIGFLWNIQYEGSKITHWRPIEYK